MKKILLLVTVLMFINIFLISFKHHRHVIIDEKKTPVAQKQNNNDGKTSPLNIPEEIVPEFIDIPIRRKYPDDGSVFNDVLSHSIQSLFGNQAGRSTNVHETAHGIHSEIRNQIGGNVNAFYALNGKAVVIPEPKIRKRDVIGYIPNEFRSDRFRNYISGQGAWDAQPLYIMDEWTAYVLGGKCCVDDVKNGRYREAWRDGVSGCLDLSIFTVSLCMAVKDKDPEYWQNNKQFKSFAIWQLKEANKTFLEGRNMSQFKWNVQDELLRQFLTNGSAQQMREFVKNELDGVWLDDTTSQSVINATYEPYQTQPVSVVRCMFSN